MHPLKARTPAASAAAFGAVPSGQPCCAPLPLASPAVKEYCFEAYADEDFKELVQECSVSGKRRGVLVAEGMSAAEQAMHQRQQGKMCSWPAPGPPTCLPSPPLHSLALCPALQATNPTLVISSANPANAAIMCTGDPITWKNMQVTVTTDAGTARSDFIQKEVTTAPCL